LEAGLDEHDDNLHGVFLHVLADTLGSVSVIISSFLIHFFGWKIADPICSLGLSILIGLSVIPLLRMTAVVLLQRTPTVLIRKYSECVQKIKSIPGVIEVMEPHLWSFSGGQNIGSLHIKVEMGANEQKILKDVHKIMKKYVQNLTVQINK